MSYTLDTSAVLAYFLDEPGSDEVEEILQLAEKGQLEVFVSFMTFMELLYRIWKLKGERRGEKAYLLLRGLPVHEILQDEDLLIASARLKANYSISVADAWIAATALYTDTTLVHKDPEMESLEHVVSLKTLPYK